MKRRDLLQTGFGFAAAATVPAIAPAIAASRAPAVHALLIGIDNYRLSPLAGCQNDLQDLAGAMAPIAATVTTLKDKQATRASVLRAWQDVAGRCAPGDWLFWSFSGHGHQKKEAIPGSKPDGMDDFIVLAPFHPASDPEEILMGSEIGTMLAALRPRDVSVLFVADCCHSGGMTRGIQSAARNLQRYRTLEGKYAVDDLLSSLAKAPPPPPDPPAAFLSHVHFFAGCVKGLTVPEISFQGKDRGALSVAVARALSSGEILTARSLADQVVSGVPALADGRQHPDLTLGSAPDRPLFGIDPGGKSAGQVQVALPPKADPPVSLRVDGPQDAAAKAALAALANVNIVGTETRPDLIWDAQAHRAVSGAGDLIADDVPPSALQASIDRRRALRRLQELVVSDPLELSVTRRDVQTRGLGRAAVLTINNDAHPAGAVMALTSAKRNYPGVVVFNLAGNGTVQLLYPGDSEPLKIPTSQPFEMEGITVRPPFGADHVVMLATTADTTGLIKTLNALNERARPLDAVNAMEATLGQGKWQLGLAGLFTRAA